MTSIWRISCIMGHYMCIGSGHYIHFKTYIFFLIIDSLNVWQIHQRPNETDGDRNFKCWVRTKLFEEVRNKAGFFKVCPQGHEKVLIMVPSMLSYCCTTTVRIIKKGVRKNIFEPRTTRVHNVVNMVPYSEIYNEASLVE